MMDINTLEKAWREQVVHAGNEPASAITARLRREVSIARRRVRGGIVLAAGVLFLGWAIGIAAHVLKIKMLTPMALAASAVHLIFFTAFIVRALRSLEVIRRERAMTSGTLRESVIATLQAVDVQIQNARIAAWAIPLVVAIDAWLYVAKYFAGEFPGFGVVAGNLFMLLLGAAIGAAVWHRYRKHLIPLRQELTEQLLELESKNG